MYGSGIMIKIKEFNDKEKEIYDLSMKKEEDLEKIDYLLKHGASSNAVEITKYNDDNVEEELLFTMCMQDSNFDNLKLLKIFIDNGLDIDKYINNIFDALLFTYDENNYIDMTKLILKTIKNKDNIDLNISLESIGLEESYNNCCTKDHKYANKLSIIYEMIQNFKDNKDPNKYFDYDKILNQEIKDIDLFCKDLKIDFDNKLISSDIDLIIKCDDTLTILNKYIFVNNNEVTSKYERIYDDNRFLQNIKKNLIHEKIEKIELKNKDISSFSKVTQCITMIIIYLSNNKKIIIDLDESLNNMRIRFKK